MTTPHWLDILPPIPLEAGVVLPDGAVVAYPTQSEGWTPGFVAVLGPTGTKRWQDRAGKPGLNHASGFAYALRWYLANGGNEYRLGKAAGGDARHGDALIWRHLRSATTEADRLAVARALAEVTA